MLRRKPKIAATLYASVDRMRMEAKWIGSGFDSASSK